MNKISIALLRTVFSCSKRLNCHETLRFPVYCLHTCDTSLCKTFVNTRQYSKVVITQADLMDKPEKSTGGAGDGKKPALPKHVKYRDKQGGYLPRPSKIDVVVIGSGGRGTPACVMIVTDYLRYLFNCGEGTQRIATEHRSKLSRLENIFITQKTWSNLGGFLGMALTLAATGIPKFTVHGPTGVEKMVQMTRVFSDTDKISKCEKRELSDVPYEDSAMVIDHVSLFPDKIHSNQIPAETEEAESEENGDKSRGMVVAYVCSPLLSPRTLNLEKCVDLNVPIGPMLRVLKEEKEVTLEDGTVIHPDQVLDPADPLQSIIVLQCPSEHYIDSFVNCNKFFTKPDGEQRDVNMVVHMTPDDVIQNPKYKQFIDKFGESTNHIVLNETCDDVCYEGIYRYQTKLNLVHPEIFPRLKQQKKSTPDHPRFVYGSTNLSYVFRGTNKGFNSDNVLNIDHEAMVTETLKAPNVEESLAALKQRLIEYPLSDGPKYPEIVFLGTGSSVPNKTRNVSGILVNVSENSSLLLDCGENTVGQLYRHYGDRTNSILQNLQGVFVSHMHADHHLGLFGLLKEYENARQSAQLPQKALTVLSPKKMFDWFNFYREEIESLYKKIWLIPLGQIMPDTLRMENSPFYKFMQTLNLKQFLPVEVIHVRNSYGLVIEHTDGWKLVYSGDTMPCENLVDKGKNCDILIHEATMGDDLEDEAKFKSHSTTSQAIQIGKKMGAKHVILNHFSQRYSKLPLITDKMSNVAISFDHMQINRNQIPMLPLCYDALKCLFAEDYAKVEVKREKKHYKREREKDSLKRKNTDSTENENNKGKTGKKGKEGKKIAGFSGAS